MTEFVKSGIHCVLLNILFRYPPTSSHTNLGDISLDIDAESYPRSVEEVKPRHDDSVALVEIPRPIDRLLRDGEMNFERDFGFVSTRKHAECEVEGADLAVGSFAGASGAGASPVASAVSEFRGEVVGDSVPRVAFAVVDRGTRRRN